MYRVLIAEPIHEKGVALLRKETEVIIRDVNTDIQGFFDSQIEGADGIIVRGFPINRELIEKAKTLKVIGVHGTGYNHIDIDFATSRKILVVNTPGIPTEAVAEHVLGLMLAITRHITYADRRIRSGKIYSPFDQDYIGCELYQKILGIIGIGKIGLEVAKKCIRAFDMKVLGYYPFVMSIDKRKIVDDLGIEICNNLHEMLKQIDVLSINVPLTDQTRNMISVKELNLMKSSAYLVNTARGSVVDESALIKALRNNRIAGAGLDVLVQEPPSRENPLLTMENVCLTPHIAGCTKETLAKIALTVCAQVLKVLRGEKPDYIVNPEALK